MLENDELEKLRSLSDNELGDKISIAVKALSGGKSDLKLSDSDLAKIKNAVRSMKLGDINAALRKMDSSQTEKIKDIMKNTRSDT